MNKKLPNLYVNRIEKKLLNNDTVFYSALNKEKEIVKPSASVDIDIQSIEDKIDELFKSSNYVYKMNVTLTLKDNSVINKDVIGQVDNKLITIDEELIDINDIKDIKF